MDEDTDMTSADASSSHLSEDKVKAMLGACLTGNTQVVQTLAEENRLYACQQDHATGRSPLMAAASVGNVQLCHYLLESPRSAPWNAVDRYGKCAGDYATNNQHWDTVNMLVDWGVRSELILGMLERSMMTMRSSQSQQQQQQQQAPSTSSTQPVEQQPSTKPDYLRQRLQYTDDGKALLDEDKDAVMMEWERPLMKAHAQILMELPHSTANGGNTAATLNTARSHSRRVLNVGFGMGIIDTALQQLQPAQHIIIEAHPQVYKRMVDNGGWDKKPNVRICYGKWQDVIPQLVKEGVVVDAIFYDTYGEHYLDMEDFHTNMVNLLSKPHGVYSFFNGLAPDNLFFHGVACQCVKLQLSQLGLDSEFLPCEIQVKDEVWEGIRRKYWHGRDTYYLPRITWNQEFLATGTPKVEPVLEEAKKNKMYQQGAITENGSTKKPKFA